MPSRLHDLLAWSVPRLRKAGELDDPDRERARIERWHTTLKPGLPTKAVPLFGRRWSVRTEQTGGFPTYVVTRRGTAPSRTLVWVHGGGFMAPIDAFHVLYATRLAERLDARIVMPDYPLTPEHTWADSHDVMADLVARCAAEDETVLAGDSAGGAIALSLAQTLRDRGDVLPHQLLLVSPWVDPSNSTPDESLAQDAIDPWLFLSKAELYARWWAGSDDDLTRPEVSPALGRLDGLPPTLMLCGTRDLVLPGCRLLASRAAGTGWDLTYLEEPDLIHVFPLLPLIPEARKAWRQTLEWLGA